MRVSPFYLTGWLDHYWFFLFFSYSSVSCDRSRCLTLDGAVFVCGVFISRRIVGFHVVIQQHPMKHMWEKDFRKLVDIEKWLLNLFGAQWELFQACIRKRRIMTVLNYIIVIEKNADQFWWAFDSIFVNQVNRETEIVVSTATANCNRRNLADGNRFCFWILDESYIFADETCWKWQLMAIHYHRSEINME